jgi:hypothetical protein
LAVKKLEIEEHPEDISNTFFLWNIFNTHSIKEKNFEAIHAINSNELVIVADDADFFSFCCSSLPR